MAAAEQTIQISGEPGAGAVFRHGRKIGSCLPVKQTEFLQLLSSEMTKTMISGIEKLLQALPMSLALAQPAV